MGKNNTSKKSPEELRTRYIRARVSETEYVKISNLAEKCGLSLSNYFRKCVLGQHPKCRLTEKEIEALNSLADARGDVVKITNALSGRTQEERKRYFASLQNWRRHGTVSTLSIMKERLMPEPIQILLIITNNRVVFFIIKLMRSHQIVKNIERKRMKIFTSKEL